MTKRVTEMWREVVKRAQIRAQREGRKLTPMRFHDLRHEYAIRYLEKGGSLYTLQKLLGHGSIRQTEGYLSYLTPEQAARSAAGTAQK
jgi:integrase/recombinase XerD